GGDAGLDLGQHAAGDDAGLDHVIDLLDGDVADAAVGVGGVAADAVGVGNDHQLLRLHRRRHGAGGGVGVDVQLSAGVVAGDGRCSAAPGPSAAAGPPVPSRR